MPKKILRALLTTAMVVCLAACNSEPQAVPDATAPQAPVAGQSTATTQSHNAQVAQRLPLADPTDFERARKGLLGSLSQDITGADGSVVWPVHQFDFLAGAAPDTVNPSLWRQSQLASIHGVFEVMDGLYQVRGYDLAVMSVIRGSTGWIIVDPLTTTETAAAALQLVNDTLGHRPVTGLLYTHSHADHFGGARGILTDQDRAEREVPILAPRGFSASAVAENLLAGNQMSRRVTLMFGNTLPRSPIGHVGSGLGPGVPNGTIGLLLPTEEISGRGTRRVIDGITFEFIDAAGTEAPAEFMFYLPQLRALCTAEVATGTLHNILTLRGARVRDALAWSRTIDHVLARYGDQSDVVFASHHWPTWEGPQVRRFLQSQRDIYRYIHDQTLRMANAGGTPVEIADALQEPDFSRDQFHVRGYYGTLNHNAKAVYQHYFGWWGGVPAEFTRHPHEVSAPRYVAAMGGAEAALTLGAEAFASGDYRWAAEVFNHVVFAEPDNQRARDWLAAAYEQQGFQAESGTWRSYFLAAAFELRNGVPELGNPQLGNADFLRAVPTLALFDAVAARYLPEQMTREPFAINFHFPDTNEKVAVHVNLAVVVARTGEVAEAAAGVSLNRVVLDQMLLGSADFASLVQSGALQVSGDPTALVALLGALDKPPFWFNVVTP